jgi:hypothetical protein
MINLVKKDEIMDIISYLKNRDNFQIEPYYDNIDILYIHNQELNYFSAYVIDYKEKVIFDIAYLEENEFYETLQNSVFNVYDCNSYTLFDLIVAFNNNYLNAIDINEYRYNSRSFEEILKEI